MSQLYSFHPLADQKQDEIWHYSYQQWGEAKADKYIDALHTALQTAAYDLKHPSVRQLPENVAKGVFFIHCQKHYLFFRLAEKQCIERIQVLTILHENMDIPTRINQELESLQNKHQRFIHEAPPQNEEEQKWRVTN